MVILFCFSSIKAQKGYNDSIQEATRNFEGKVIAGYITDFHFSRKDIRRGWWEYARKFGNPINMKEYYKVKIPASYTDGNVDLMIFSKIEEREVRIMFFLGIEESEFKEQIQTIIVEFKRNFYINKILEEIEHRNKEAATLSESYSSTFISEEKQVALQKLVEVNIAIEKLEKKIKDIVLD